MDAKGLRNRREGERGQVLVLFILIMVTCFLFAIVAVSVGQVMVRRHQAQAVVDAAAFAGAVKQAEGLNTIARFNEKSLNFLRAVQMSKAVPYVDSNSTTWVRYGESFIGPLALPFTSDWAGDVLKDYQNIFDVFDAVILAVNYAYSPFSPIGPWGAAREVIDRNFEGDNSLFDSSDLADHGFLVTPDRWEELGGLVKLTDRETYEINGYLYAPNPSNGIIVNTCPLIFPLDEPCLQLLAYYGAVNGYFFVKRLIDPIEYEIGRFYDNPEGHDVRFTYYLRVSQTPVLFGKNFFEDIPPIVVAA